MWSVELAQKPGIQSNSVNLMVFSVVQFNTFNGENLNVYEYSQTSLLLCNKAFGERKRPLLAVKAHYQVDRSRHVTLKHFAEQYSVKLLNLEGKFNAL